MDDQLPIIVASSVTYYHSRDESSFFAWLRKMICVVSFDGRGRDLFIRLKRRPTDNDLRELVAFAYRYKFDLEQFRQFADPERRPWFSDPRAYWHEGVFGSSASAERP